MRGLRWLHLAVLLGLWVSTLSVLHAAPDTPVVGTRTCKPFFPANVYLAGTSPASLVAADFNGDGIPDLASDERYSGKVDVLLGTGDGKFQRPKTFPSGAGYPRKLAAADFNGDNMMDIAVADESQSGGGVDILLGIGDGTFQPPLKSVNTYGADSVAVGDFNRDGIPDLATVTGGPPVAEVWLGRGDGNFSSPIDYTVGDWPSAVTVADFDGDSRLDLAVADSGWDCTSGHTVSVLAGNGDGTFRAKVDYDVGCEPFDVTAADLNGDGTPDLATADFLDGTTSVLLNRGDGSFRTARAYITAHPYAPYSVAAVQFERGDKVGLMVATIAGTFILRNNGDGSFGNPQGYEPDSRAVVAADFDGDGKADLALSLATPNDVSGVAVLRGKGDGLFAAATAYVALPNLRAVVVGDFNGDGKPDLAATDDNPGYLAIMAGLGQGRFSQPQHYYSMPGALTVAVGDFDRDGKLDLAVAVESSAVQIMHGNGDGTFTPGETLSLSGASWLLSVADVNGDGIWDLVAVSIGRQSTVNIFLGKGDGTFRRGQTYMIPESAEGLVVADFDGDHKLDIGVTAFTGFNSDMNIFLGNGDGTFNASKPFMIGMGGAFAVGDFDHDGKLDFAVGVAVLGETYQVRVFLGNGNGTFRTGTSFSAPRYASSVVAADFNGDGLPDIAVPSENAIMIYLNKGNGTFAHGMSAFAGPGTPVVADLNKDGGADLAVPNYNGGEISILLNRCSK